MKVTSERLPDAQIVLSIEVEPEQIAKAEQRAYQSLVNRLNVPGFRRGKAPRYLIERMIGGAEALRAEGIERLVPEVYREAIKQEGIAPIDQPELDIVSQEPLIVKATVPIEPTVELGDYKSIHVPKVPVEVPYERINETLERLREQRTEWIPVERAVSAGDRITADVNGTIGAAPTLYDPSGQPLLQTEGRDSLIDSKNAEIAVDPESTSPVPGFHKEVVGIVPKGVKRFLLNIPEDWPNEAQRKQSVLFQVTVHEVKEARAPALDDDFAKGLGEDYSSMEELREGVRERLRQQLEHEAEHAHRDQVIQAAIETSSFEMAPALVRRETDRLIQNFGQNLARQGLALEQYLRLTRKTEDEMRAELRPQAETNLKSYLLLREVARAESIDIEDVEIDAEVERIAGLIGGDAGDADRARQYLARQRESGDIRASLWERKVTDYLIGLAQQPADAAAEPAAEAAPAEEQPAEDDAAKPKRSRSKAPTRKD